ncbi:hypothetical protein ON010_g9598 [Phytophthora cinnamomi]|nr:hypothetical protein ON010_g9598 [Phytophthora cinnamomi]
MQDYALHPPNDLALSEDVIGSVVQRAWPSRRFMVYRGDITYPTERPMRHSKGATTATSGHTQVTKRSSTSTTEEQHATEDLDDEDEQSTLRRLHDTDPEAYHRERRRRNQERYREKQRKLADDLVRGNQQLRDEIKRLEHQRNNISCGISTKETIWSVAVEYFRVFRRGLHIPKQLSPGDRIVELDFMRATMAQDLDAGTVRGFELLAKNWKVFTQYFKDVEVKLGRLDQIADRALVASTTTSFTFTTHSLRYMFPHLVGYCDGRRKRSRWPHIADKLLGHRLVVHGSVHFHWDEVNNRMSGGRVVCLSQRTHPARLQPRDRRAPGSAPIRIHRQAEADRGTVRKEVAPEQGTPALGSAAGAHRPLPRARDVRVGAARVAGGAADRQRARDLHGRRPAAAVRGGLPRADRAAAGLLPLALHRHQQPRRAVRGPLHRRAGAQGRGGQRLPRLPGDGRAERGAAAEGAGARVAGGAAWKEAAKTARKERRKREGQEKQQERQAKRAKKEQEAQQAEEEAEKEAEGGEEEAEKPTLDSEPKEEQQQQQQEQQQQQKPKQQQSAQKPQRSSGQRSPQQKQQQQNPSGAKKSKSKSKKRRNKQAGAGNRVES